MPKITRDPIKKIVMRITYMVVELSLHVCYRKKSYIMAINSGNENIAQPYFKSIFSNYIREQLYILLLLGGCCVCVMPNKIKRIII